MKKFILSAVVGIGITGSAFAGSWYEFNESIDDFLAARAQAQYEAQVQQQLDDINAQVSQMAASAQAQAQAEAQTVQRQQEIDLYTAFAQQQLENKRLAQQENEEAQLRQQQNVNLQQRVNNNEAKLTSLWFSISAKNRTHLLKSQQKWVRWYNAISDLNQRDQALQTHIPELQAWVKSER